MNKTFWLNLAMSLLIIGMFLLQYSPELEEFKYWICFVIVVGAVCCIVYNTFVIASKLSKANKEIIKANKQIADLEKTVESNNPEISSSEKED